MSTLTEFPIAGYTHRARLSDKEGKGLPRKTRITIKISFSKYRAPLGNDGTANAIVFLFFLYSAGEEGGEMICVCSAAHPGARYLLRNCARFFDKCFSLA